MPKSDTQFKKGQSGNPSGRPKIIRAVQDLAREYTEEAIEKLVALMRNANNESVQNDATKHLLAIAWGKPVQTQNVNVNDKRTALDWSRDELVAFLSERRADRDRAAETRGRPGKPDPVH